MQTFLVLVTFCLAIGFLIRKFLWNPKRKQDASGPFHGEGGTCGKSGCGCE